MARRINSFGVWGDTAALNSKKSPLVPPKPKHSCPANNAKSSPAMPIHTRPFLGARTVRRARVRGHPPPQLRNTAARVPPQERFVFELAESLARSAFCDSANGDNHQNQAHSNQQDNDQIAVRELPRRKVFLHFPRQVGHSP